MTGIFRKTSTRSTDKLPKESAQWAEHIIKYKQQCGDLSGGWWCCGRESSVIFASDEWHSSGITARRHTMPRGQRKRTALSRARASLPSSPGSRRREMPSRDSADAATTRRQAEAEVLAFIAEHRNANTRASYAAQWRLFCRWAEESVNPTRAAAARIDLERPTEYDVAAYCHHLVEQRGTAMSTVNVAIAAIRDHLALRETPDYHPWRGHVIKQMLAVLTPRATPSKQKDELAGAQIEALLQANADAKTRVARRDACMIQLAYHVLLRASEVARMDCGDVTFMDELVDGRVCKVMRIHVNRLSKNDAERRGHDRLVLERDAQAEHCLVRRMREYMARLDNKASNAPLFPREDGGRMSADTPRHRLHHWLAAAGATKPKQYGFHSLRAGGASDAARAGVQERTIKAHGNWASSVVQVYIRPTLDDRLAVSRALSQTMS